MKENKTKPDIRFKGFTDDWEQRKLGELLEKYEDPVETPHDGYERLGIRSHAKGTFHSFVESGEELNSARMHRVAAKKFILNITFAWEHAVAITDKNDEGKLVSHRFPQFSFDKCLKSNFFKYLILDEKFRKHLELSSPGGAGRNRVLKISDMLEYKIYLPSIDEQTEIGQYFSQLDNLITLHQREYDQLKELKKAMLKKMFPRDGSSIPEVRFAGFTDDWEQRKLGEVVDVYDGIHQTPKYTNQGIMFLSVENINTLKSKKYISEEAFYRNYKVYPQKGDILMTRIGDVGTPNVVETNEKLAFYVSLALLKPISIESYFLNNLIQSSSFQNSLKKRTLLTAIPQKINKDQIGKIDVVLSLSSNEQKKIGQYFSHLDNLITLHQRELEILKNLKKTCLKRMFI